MALMNCPECNREISDKAYSCPHCGFVLSFSQSNTLHVREPQPTQIGPQSKNLVTGSFGTIGGLALMVIGILMIFVVFPIGIILVIAGVAILSKGNSAAVGTNQVTCPYCGAPGTTETPAQSYKCPACAKRSVKRDGYLHPVK